MFIDKKNRAQIIHDIYNYLAMHKLFVLFIT